MTDNKKDTNSEQPALTDKEFWDKIEESHKEKQDWELFGFTSVEEYVAYKQVRSTWTDMDNITCSW